jgi:hypothetical protein
MMTIGNKIDSALRKAIVGTGRGVSWFFNQFTIPTPRKAELQRLSYTTKDKVVCIHCRRGQCVCRRLA